MKEYESKVGVRLPKCEVVLDLDPRRSKVYLIGGGAYTKTVDLTYSMYCDKKVDVTGTGVRVDRIYYVDVHKPFSERTSTYRYSGLYSDLKDIERAYKDSVRFFSEDPVVQQLGNTELQDKPKDVAWAVVDIETATGPGMPTGDDAIILLIGLGLPGVSYIWEADYTIGKDGRKVFDDSRMVQDFLQFITTLWRQGKLDVLAGFYVGFDITILKEAMNRAGVDVQWGIPIGDARINVSRYMKNYTLRSRGIAILDLWEMGAIRDQTLQGIPKSLKSVSTHFGFPHQAFEWIKNTVDHFESEQFRQYLLDDLDATRTLLGVYLSRYIAQANRSIAPLAYICRCSRGFTGTAACKIAFKDTEILGLRTNLSVYGGTSYEGALGGMRQRCAKCGADVGLIIKHELKFSPKTCKCGNRLHVTKSGTTSGTSPWGIEKGLVYCDFGSYYPNASYMAFLPGSTQIVKTKPLDGNMNIEFLRKGDYLYTRSPDRNAGQVYILRSYLGDSPFKALFDRMFQERKDIKRRMKEIDPFSGEYHALDALQYSIKTMINSIYGWNGSPDCYNGDISVALGIIALTKWVTRRIVAHLGERLIHLDTDGFIFRGDISEVDKLNKMVAGWIKEIGLENRFYLEAEAIDVGLFLRPKAYAVIKGGRPKFTGVVFNPSCKVIKEACRLSVVSLMEGNSPVVAWDKLKGHIQNAPVTDFVMSVKPSSVSDSYGNRGFMATIMKMAAREGHDVAPGVEIDYVKVVGGFDIWPTDQPLDYKYYVNRAGAVLKSLGYDKPTGQLRLF
jgi:DNA polymerase elongation subunit (family B)